MPKPMKTSRSSSSGRPISVWGGTRNKQWTVPEWVADQEAETYHRMTIRWAELRRLFRNDPWGAEGPAGRARQDGLHGRLQRRPLPRVRLRQQLPQALQGQTGAAEQDQEDDAQLMLLGFDWIKLFLWGIRSRRLKPKGR
ncbi:MAG: hypothetical protein MZU95_01035 [Desulfomicrobium escambiense]|nr:hypothetical protein [Desulfomicrobium escambiense]